MSMQNPSIRVGPALMCAFSITVLCAMLPGTAQADAYNKRTTATFSAPVEIPGVGAQVLPAGTYVFRLLDSLVNRNIVQIFNEDETHLYATILAIPNRRLNSTDETVMTFAERAAGEPQAIRAWFYPGFTSGQEFVYPRTRAVALAKAAQVPVLYMPDEMAESIVAPIETATAPAVAPLRTVPLKAVDPSGQDVAVAQVVESPPVQSASLPQTASILPVLALMGLLSMALGLSMKASCDS